MSKETYTLIKVVLCKTWTLYGTWYLYVLTETTKYIVYGLYYSLFITVL